MTHLDDDTLLLHAGGELDPPRAADVQRHLERCAECRTRFRALAEAGEAAAWALERRPGVGRRRAPWLALPLAAAVGALLLWSRAPAPARASWTSTSVASPQAGYVTGPAFMALDSQLARLERERLYGSRMD
jgi:hypothetical protein